MTLLRAANVYALTYPFMLGHVYVNRSQVHQPADAKGSEGKWSKITGKQKSTNLGDSYIRLSKKATVIKK